MEIIIRSLRFLYLLWGSILIGTVIINSRIQLPKFMGRWNLVVQFLFTSPWGQGLLIGITVAMSLAAIIEIWELVNKLLTNSSLRKEKREE